MRPVSPCGHLDALLVVELEHGAARRLAGGARARRACPRAWRSWPTPPRSSRRGCRGCRRTRPSTRWPGRPAARSRWRPPPSATTRRTSRASPRAGRGSAASSPAPPPATSALRAARSARSDSSGSNLRVSTIVVPSSRPRVKCAKPHEWNSGAAMCELARYCSGIFDSNETAGSSESGEPRLAPFGVPVVPEVRMITLPVLSGGTGCSVGPVCDQLLERGVVERRRSRDPGDEALAPRCRRPRAGR